MQKLNCVHKEIDNAFSLGANYSFRESGLQITLRLSSSLGNKFRKHKSVEKKYWAMFFNRIAVHMHNF